MTIRVLGLTDSLTQSVTYYTDRYKVGYTSEGIMRMMAQPHTEKYEFRHFLTGPYVHGNRREDGLHALYMGDFSRMNYYQAFDAAWGD